jgi:hypothetical protein
MKRVLVLLGFWVLLANVEAAPPTNQNGRGPASSNGADLVRGAWGGTLSLPDGARRQMNLYFNATTQEPQNPAYSKASGYFANDDVGGQKRAKAPALPMMASFMKSGEGTFDVVLLATFQIPSGQGSGTIVMKLAGKAALRGSAVTDDIMEGTWFVKGSKGQTLQGPWSARHLDRRNVNAPTVDLSDPTLRFGADVYANLEGPAPATSPDQREPWTCLGAGGNIVMDRVRVTRPDGTTVVVPPYTDVFSSRVDWETAFRFSTWLPGLPVAGGRYVFTALDVAGSPIPGVVASDVWVGVEPPDPPTNVWAYEDAEGIVVKWNTVPDVGSDEVGWSFEPASGIGFYQLELSDDGLPPTMVYGANGISTSSHLIPLDSGDFKEGVDWGFSLNELPPGSYSLRTSVVSFAPEGSAGHGIEYHNADSMTQTIWIQIPGDLE